MNKYFTALLTIAALGTASAAHDPSCVDGVSDPELTTCANEGEICSVYLDEDQCPGYLYSIWLYAETNGIHGLQRSDEGPGRACSEDGVHDPCPGHDADFLIF